MRRNSRPLFLIALLLALQVSPFLARFAYAEALSMEQVVRQALDRDAELREAKGAVTQSNMKLSEAFAALANVVEKDLFFLMVRQRSITRDVELGLKVPQALKAIFLAGEELRAKEREVRANIEKLYISTYQSKHSAERARESLGKARRRLEELRIRERYGRASEDQVKAAEEDVVQAESTLKQALLAHKRNKIELGRKIGRDLETVELELEVPRFYVPLNQSNMWRFVQNALAEDLELVKAREEMKMAETTVRVVRTAMNIKFTPAVTGIVESMFDSGAMQYDSESFDYDRLLVNYNIMIGLAEAAWYPIIPIPIPMMPFMIPLPLKLLQGDFDGQRYLNDERMILPTKMKELDEARTKVKELQAAIINKIKTSYLEAKQAEEAYIQALRKEELARRAEEEARTSYAFGTLPEDKWEEIQKASEEAEKAAFDAYVAYRDALTKLDLESAGGVMPMKIDGILPWGSVEDDGLAPLNQAPETPVAPKGEWFVKTTVENMKSEFSIKVEDPASFGAEQYALKTRRDYQIGKMQPLDGKIGHLDFVFANIKDLRVYFYNGGGDIVAEARLDGYGTQGQLQITTR